MVYIITNYIKAVIVHIDQSKGPLCFYHIKKHADDTISEERRYLQLLFLYSQ